MEAKMSEKATRQWRAIVEIMSAVVFLCVLAYVMASVYMAVRHVDMPHFVLILVAICVALIATYPLLDLLHRFRRWSLERWLPLNSTAAPLARD
jgi:membrane protein YdbS with pleckstrin-like domain